MNRTPLPQPLTLRKHLDGCTVDELREFLRFWGPHEKTRKGRGHLVSALRRLMADENVVYGKVELLSEKVRTVLMALLRKTHYTADLAALFRGIEGLEIEHYEAEAALTALARRGFVRSSRTPDVAAFGRSIYAIPKQMAMVMRGLAGTDNRSLPQLFVHADFELTAVHARSGDTLADLPRSVNDATAALTEPVSTIVETVLHNHGGILTRREFGDLFGASPRWNTALFSSALAEAGLGTVAHLDLRNKGLGIDDDALILFSEAVERYVAELRERELEHDRVVCTHGTFQSDIRTTFEIVRDTTVKVSKEGQVYKAAVARIADQLRIHVPPLLDRRDTADAALAVLRGLRLIVVSDGVLAPTDAGVAWMEKTLVEKVEASYRVLLTDGVRTLRSKHLRRLQAIAEQSIGGAAESSTTLNGETRDDAPAEAPSAETRERTPEGTPAEIPAETPDERNGAEAGAAPHSARDWWPGMTLAWLTRNRHLLAITRDDAETVRGASLSNTPVALTELGRAIHERIVHDWFRLGLVDVALRGDEVAGVRLSRLGERILGEAAEEPASDARPLIVNPDYEVLVLPEGDVDDLLHDLDRIAVQERAGEVMHYRLDQKRIERVCVDGDVTADLLAWLNQHARSPVPQNVVYSVQSWGTGVRSATMEPGILLRASDEGVIQAAQHDDRIRPWIAAIVDETTLFLKPGADRPEVVQALRALGVYLRES